MKNSVVPLLGVLAACLLASPGARAFTFITNSETKLPYILASGTTGVTIRLGTTPTLSDGSNYNTSAQAAAAAWNAQIGSMQFAPQLAAAGAATDRNRVNEMSFDSTVFGREFEGNTIAVTTTWVRGNERTEGDIIFNNKRTWDSYRGSVRFGAIDIQRVALHELGHLLGLDHPDEAGQSFTPTPIMNSNVTSRDTLTPDDIGGAQSLYGPPGIPANNNFADATAINLGSATTVTVTGHNTNATKETGEPRHATYAGGRSVWWKWFAPANGTVTLDTRKSYFDTLLGVYTGTTVAALTTIASSDDIDPGVVQASSLTFTATGGTTYFFAVDGFDGDNAGISLNLAFTSTGPSVLPTFATQPVSQTVTAGQTATFTAVAVSPISSSQPTYQWFFNGAALAGATNGTLTITNAQSAANGGNYAVVASIGGGSATSNTVTLTVNAAPTPPPTPPPSSGGGGGGGGGGAPSLWFLAILGALSWIRWLRSRR
jgi:hypothetical protein